MECFFLMGHGGGSVSFREKKEKRDESGRF